MSPLYLTLKIQAYFQTRNLFSYLSARLLGLVGALGGAAVAEGERVEVLAQVADQVGGGHDLKKGVLKE